MANMPADEMETRIDRNGVLPPDNPSYDADLDAKYQAYNRFQLDSQVMSEKIPGTQAYEEDMAKQRRIQFLAFDTWYRVALEKPPRVDDNDMLSADVINAGKNQIEQLKNQLENMRSDDLRFQAQMPSIHDQAFPRGATLQRDQMVPNKKGGGSHREITYSVDGKTFVKHLEQFSNRDDWQRLKGSTQQINPETGRNIGKSVKFDTSVHPQYGAVSREEWEGISGDAVREEFMAGQGVYHHSIKGTHDSAFRREELRVLQVQIEKQYIDDAIEKAKNGNILSAEFQKTHDTRIYTFDDVEKFKRKYPRLYEAAKEDIQAQRAVNAIEAKIQSAKGTRFEDTKTKHYKSDKTKAQSKQKRTSRALHNLNVPEHTSELQNDTPHVTPQATGSSLRPPADRMQIDPQQADSIMERADRYTRVETVNTLNEKQNDTLTETRNALVENAREQLSEQQFNDMANKQKGKQGPRRSTKL